MKSDPIPMARSVGPAAVLAATIILGAAPVQAHTDGSPLMPHDFWTSWSLQPSVMLPLATAMLLFAQGTLLAWRKAGRGRGVASVQVACFASGILALFAALIWPLGILGESLFAVHMAQHIILMGVAAPLIVLGHPMPTMMRALPREWQRSLASLVTLPAWRSGWRWLSGTGFATTLQLVVFLFWHAPPSIALSLDNDFVHSVMHGSILGTALLFWTAVLRTRFNRFGAGILALFVTFKFSLLVGSLLAFSGKVLYPSYANRPAAWGYAPIDDQHLAGVLMVTAGSMMYLIAAVALGAAAFSTMAKGQPFGAGAAARRWAGS